MGWLLTFQMSTCPVRSSQPWRSLLRLLRFACLFLKVEQGATACWWQPAFWWTAFGYAALTLVITGFGGVGRHFNDFDF